MWYFLISKNLNSFPPLAPHNSDSITLHILKYGPHSLHSQHPLSQVVLLQIFGTITQVYDFATILIYSHLFLDIYIPPPSFFIPWSNPFDSPKITLVNIFYLFSHILPHYSILFNSRTPYSNNNFLLKVSCLSLFNCHHLIFGLKIDSHFGFILFNCISRTNSLCCVVTPCPRTTLQLVYNFLSWFIAKRSQSNTCEFHSYRWLNILFASLNKYIYNLKVIC